MKYNITWYNYLELVDNSPHIPEEIEENLTPQNSIDKKVEFLMDAIQECYYWLAQNIWNSDFTIDKKWEYVKYKNYNTNELNYKLTNLLQNHPELINLEKIMENNIEIKKAIWIAMILLDTNSKIENIMKHQKSELKENF